MSWQIGLIGTGNVAAFWAKILNNRPGISIHVSGKNQAASFQFCSSLNIANTTNLGDCDFFLVCVQDSEIKTAVALLPRDKAIFICTGLFSLAELPEYNLGIIYPLQTLRKEVDTPIDHVPFLCEFKENNQMLGEEFLNKIAARYSHCSEKDRYTAHASAVFINNFSYYIAKQGLALAKSQNLSLDLFKPIIQQSYSNLLIEKDLQTGPARRNDQETIAKHLSLLPQEYRELYEVLTKHITATFNP